MRRAAVSRFAASLIRAWPSILKAVAYPITGCPQLEPIDEDPQHVDRRRGMPQLMLTWVLGDFLELANHVGVRGVCRHDMYPLPGDRISFATGGCLSLDL
jgi:hypothetical protein